MLGSSHYALFYSILLHHLFHLPCSHLTTILSTRQSFTQIRLCLRYPGAGATVKLALFELLPIRPPRLSRLTRQNISTDVERGCIHSNMTPQRHLKCCLRFDHHEALSHASLDQSEGALSETWPDNLRERNGQYLNMTILLPSHFPLYGPFSVHA